MKKLFKTLIIAVSAPLLLVSCNSAAGQESTEISVTNTQSKSKEDSKIIADYLIAHGDKDHKVVTHFGNYTITTKYGDSVAKITCYLAYRKNDQFTVCSEIVNDYNNSWSFYSSFISLNDKNVQGLFATCTSSANTFAPGFSINCSIDIHHYYASDFEDAWLMSIPRTDFDNMKFYLMYRDLAKFAIDYATEYLEKNNLPFIY